MRNAHPVALRLSVWARGGSLSCRAYRRAQRNTARRVRLAKLYGEKTLAKYPVAMDALNYVRTRDPAIRDDLVHQFGSTATVCLAGDHVNHSSAYPCLHTQVLHR